MPKILFVLLMLFIFSCDAEPVISNPKYWNYEIEYEIETTDSIKPIGQIEFRRIKSVKDKLREETYNENWYPSMAFEIYKISDLKYCKEISRKLWENKLLSPQSCPQKWSGIIPPPPLTYLRLAGSRAARTP